jgi:hypothetical protein
MVTTFQVLAERLSGGGMSGTGEEERRARTKSAELFRPEVSEKARQSGASYGPFLQTDSVPQGKRWRSSCRVGAPSIALLQPGPRHGRKPDGSGPH